MSRLPPIKGFNKTTEASDKVFVPSIFVGGCNLKCPYCMNMRLANNSVEEDVPFEEIQWYIQRENPQMVIISGGEPTCVPLTMLKNLIEEIRSLDCLVGLCTNGIESDIMKEIIGDLAYVALDIKSPSPYDYYAMGTNLMHGVLITKSLLVEERMNRPNFGYEIRTTLFPPFIDKKSLRELGGIIKKDEKWVLQQYRVASKMFKPNEDVTPYTQEELEELLDIAKEFSNHVSLRFV
jgi:pyruvate formate lyase activating enzyme